MPFAGSQGEGWGQRRFSSTGETLCALSRRRRRTAWITSHAALKPLNRLKLGLVRGRRVRAKTGGRLWAGRNISNPLLTTQTTFYSKCLKKYEEAGDKRMESAGMDSATAGASVTNKPILLQALDGHVPGRTPIWMMRQAGRYLPEYREVRAKAGDFLTLCYTPDYAVEVTLQPIRRFGFDAAILFSDILVVPHALGCPLTFEAGEGPRLVPVTTGAELAALRETLDPDKIDRVLEAVSRIRAELPAETALLGFCGAPWTVATYMVAGRGTPDQAPARLASLTDPAFFTALIDLLVETSARYLVGQLKAGADAVQIFDSWAGVLDPTSFRRWSIDPIRRIVARVRADVPGARIIAFPKGATLSGLTEMVQATGVNAVGLDWTADRKATRYALGGKCALQGNLDPLTLIAGGAALDSAIDGILADFHGASHVFNLGHGIRPETPIAHVERMIARIRGG